MSVLSNLPMTSGRRTFCFSKTDVLYCTVSSPSDRSNRFTLHPKADLFIPTPTRIPCEAFRPAVFTVHSHIVTAVHTQIIVSKTEGIDASRTERCCLNIEAAVHELGLARLRVRCSIVQRLLDMIVHVVIKSLNSAQL